MYSDARQLPDGITLTGYDICIAGAGAAGIALATRLIGSSKKVLLISSGDSNDGGQSPAPDPTLESIYQGVLGPFMHNVDPIFLTRSRLNMYGGTTNHFWFWASPLSEADLQPRPGYRDAYWPLDLAELNRYYPDANAFGGFGPFNYQDIDFWAQALYGQPFAALPDDQLQNVIFHAQPNNNIHQFQVQFGADLQAAENVTVLFNANVLRIKATEAKNHVTGLSCATVSQGRPDKRFRVETRDYVVALGGIESVRLLLLSGDLADNAQGHLGRGFMLHPLITQAAQATFPAAVPMEIQNFFRLQMVSIAAPQNVNEGHTLITDPLYHPGQLPPDSFYLQAWGVLTPTPVAMAREQIGNFRALLSFDPPGSQAAGGSQAILNFNWEQARNENSRITLDDEQLDPVFGQPVVHLDWNLMETEKRTIIKGLALCEQYLKARGASDFKILTDLSGGPERWVFSPTNPVTNQAALQAGDHHMGALRMSAQPEDGIVDPNLKAHQLDNLYLLSTGVWPTTGCVNPTLTLVALALRLANHLMWK
ncbi:MAG: GMC family oxidoreductase [Acidobacteria bacterium]|nr:GMC family oxidoreductase [Acidobacteriota bacterium]